MTVTHFASAMDKLKGSSEQPGSGPGSNRSSRGTFEALAEARFSAAGERQQGFGRGTS